MSAFKKMIDVRRHEMPLALSMFAYFFLVISVFWILKPLKKAAFVEYYDKGGFELLGWTMQGAQAELLAKVLNMVVALAAVAVFTRLARRFARQELTLIFSLFFGVCYVFFAFIVDGGSELTVWSFYLFGDLFNTLMVATFFAFLNDAIAPADSKRLYGVIVLGGVVGGAFGTTVLRVWIAQISTSGWMWVCLVATAGIALVAVVAGRIADGNASPEPAPASDTQDASEEANTLFAAGRLVFRSRYLLSIVAIVGLYEIVSTILDFQFTSTIAHYLDGDAIGEQFATMYAITNWASLFVQFFLTGIIMTRFGMMVGLMVLPISIALGSTAFLVLPILWSGSLLTVADNALNYSVNQSAKESLYTVTTRVEKYQAKAFIDMFVQRFAKAIAVGVSLAITAVFSDFSSVRWLSLFTLLTLGLWFVAVRYAGREFDRMNSDSEEASVA